MKDWVINNISNIEAVLNIIVIISGWGICVWGGIISVFRVKLRYSQYKYLNLVIDNQVKRAMKYYIPTRGQNIDPCNEEEYATRHSFITKKMINFFVKEVFKNDEAQYYIILADSGMGKTTFLLKLFFQYYKRIFRKYNITFVPLSLENSIERIRRVKDKSSTILLLDAFDEDRYAIEDYNKRLRIICDATEEFYKVIMTCRTQFFPNNKSEPKYTGKIKFGVGNKSIEFVKYYISPFSDVDIAKYLKKKYRFFGKRTRIEAEKLIKRCPRLMMRPMLLNYIDDLIKEEGEFAYIYQIYEVLVQKWIERESVPSESLYTFTKELALLMFREKKLLRPHFEFENLCKNFESELNPIEAKAKSLLNRNAEGLYKFAHKSIYEYVLSSIALKDSNFRKELVETDFVGLDMAKLFFEEMCANYIKTENVSDLRYMRIKEENLSGYDFSLHRVDNLVFTSCKIYDCSFELAKANGIKFIDCELKNDIFNAAELTHALFSGTEIFKCEFVKADLVESTFSNLSEKKRLIKVDSCNFTDANLMRANFSGLKLADFSCIKDANLRGINLAGTVMENVHFLAGKDLGAVILRNAKMINCGMNHISFNEGDLLNISVIDTSFYGSSFLDATMKNATFRKTNFSNVEMMDTDMRHCKFDECIFFRSYFERVDMSECTFKNSEIYDNTLIELKLHTAIVIGGKVDELAKEYFSSWGIRL